MSLVERLSKRLSKWFQQDDLTSSLSREFSSMDLGGSLGNVTTSGEKLYLHRFSEPQLSDIVTRVGLKSHLKKKGFPDLLITIDIDQSQVHYFKLYAGSLSPDNILLDLRLTETKFRPPDHFFSDKIGALSFDMIVIEWLSAQNPRGVFTKDKPQLPGQKKPGLGVLNYCFEMMYLVAREVTRDGFMDVPDHMHGAVMYSRKFRFINAAHEGVLRALMRDLEEYSLMDISWGMITGSVVDVKTGKVQVYAPSEQVFPVSDRMFRYFQSQTYRSKFDEIYKKKKYTMDYGAMEKKREELLKKKEINDL